MLDLSMQILIGWENILHIQRLIQQYNTKFKIVNSKYILDGIKTPNTHYAVWIGYLFTK